jgi:hypothetical protein
MSAIEQPKQFVKMQDVVQTLIDSVNELNGELEDMREFIEESSLSEEYRKHKMVNTLKK